ncbi:MAG: hypothetical protein JSW07_15955 [bacterium]|nr:MAG: hypothetical protein JSW07_15955 [bacterium]
MKKIFLITSLLILLLIEAQAQPLVYVSSGNHSKNHRYAFAGGTACCGCMVKHYGKLPQDFISGDVKAVIFYLNTSRENSYYTKVKQGPTKLKLILGERQSIATSVKLSDFEYLPVKHKWYIKFGFEPPVKVTPGTKWEILDGDDNIYSAVWLHSSDIDKEGLPGIEEQTGCQYTHRIEQWYSVKFDLLGSRPLVVPDKKDIAPSISKKVREKVLKTAVVEFTERGNLEIQDAGAIIAEWMTTALNKTGAFEVYERLSLEKLMEEHKMGMSGLLDEETIAQIGKMRGVQAIVTGSVIKFGDIISVTAKLINTETAKIIDSADIKVIDVNTISSEIDKLAVELATE